MDAFDENHAGTFGQEVQLSIKGRSWARLYKGLDFERLVIQLTANGIRANAPTESLRQDTVFHHSACRISCTGVGDSRG